MIKKLVLLCLMCGCFSPGFAQGGKAGWYKAVLNNGEVGLVPVPASRVAVLKE